MAIIMDNVPQNSAYLTMKDDGNGNKALIQDTQLIFPQF